MYLYIYIYISNWIIEYIHLYSYTIIYSCTVNVNSMLKYCLIVEMLLNLVNRINSERKVKKIFRHPSLSTLKVL